MTRTALALLIAGSASARPDMLITVDNVSGDDWSISAEFLTPFSLPIVQVWADASFELTGDGSPITITDYNPSYDTALGDAIVINGPTASFLGNSNSFFGTPDSSNPLDVITFEYAGSFDALQFSMVGQNSVIFDSPLSDTQLYQTAQGEPGALTWDVIIVPAPGALAPLASMALVATRRRRK